MRIGELADQAGVNPKTIRYYESIGLLPAPQRMPSGYRTYDTGDLGRLVFIRTAQRLGLTLDEIREVLALREQGERPCSYVVGVLTRQLDALDQRIAEMVAVRAELAGLLNITGEQDPADERYCHLLEPATESGPATRPDGR